MLLKRAAARSQPFPPCLAQLQQHRSPLLLYRHSLSKQRLYATSSRRSSPGPQDEDAESVLPPESTVYVDKKDFSIELLAAKVDKGQLNLQPSYQRGMVWDKKLASRLVVTALENRIVPTVYLEEDENGRYLVMDGKQRLASLIAFYKRDANVGGLQWESAPTTLHVTDDTSCDIRWHGKSIDDLTPKRKADYENYTLLCVVIKNSTDRDVVFNIYQDINTGAVGHTEQQSRKAAFHGPYVELLDELAKDEHFLKIQKRDQPDSEKEADSAKKFKTPMLQFLNREIKENQKAPAEELEHRKQLFKLTTATVWQIWGGMACRDVAAKVKADSINPSLWDAVMVAVCEELEMSSKRRRELTEKAGAIREAYKQLLQDQTFRKALPSTSKGNVSRRIDMMRQMLQRVAPESHDKVRAFKREDRLLLWEAAAADGAAVLCGICQQAIHAVSDAEVDHVIPHSHGGRTALDNAQLVHGYCNRYKGNRVPRQQQQ